MARERKDNMDKYTLLEAKLAEQIANTGNEEMMNTFLDWQLVRNELNKEYVEKWLKEFWESIYGKK